MINNLKHYVFSDNADFLFYKMNFKGGCRTKQTYQVEMSLEWYFRPHLKLPGQREGLFLFRVRSFRDLNDFTIQNCRF